MITVKKKLMHELHECYVDWLIFIITIANLKTDC